jgi:hypothetical protein
MFSLGKYLFPRASRHDRRRKMWNLLLGVIFIAAVIMAAILLRASGR